jgi:hypothetical protein
MSDAERLVSMVNIKSSFYTLVHFPSCMWWVGTYDSTF